MSPPRAISACIALGSNLGDRRANLLAALDALARHDGVQVVRTSAFLETEPVGPPGQGPYLNAAVEVATTLSARELLDVMLGIERSRGRTRDPGQRWGPRTLDMDLLLYGDRVIDEPGLTVPHPRLTERLFVLEPLAAIAPERVVPGTKKSVAQWLSERVEQQRPSKPGHPPAGLAVLAIATMLGAHSAPSDAAATRPPASLLKILQEEWRTRGPGLVLERLHAEYRRGPIAERLDFTVETPNGSVRSSGVVRLDAAGAMQRLRLDVEDLIVYAQGDGVTGRVDMIHRKDPSAFARWEIQGPLSSEVLSSVLPPMPIPTVTLAFDAPGTPLLPASGEAKWFASATQPLTAGLASITCVTPGPAGSSLPVETVFSTSNWRLKRLTAVWPSREGESMVTLEVSAEHPGDPATWAIDVTGRTQTSPQAFRPREAPIRIGETMDLTPLSDLQLRPWDPKLELGAGPERTERPGEERRFALLVLYRVHAATEEASSPERGVLRAAKDVAQSVLQAGASRRANGQTSIAASVMVRPVAVFDTANFTRRGLAEQAVRLDGTVEGSSLLWTSAPGATIDRFDADATVALVLIDASWRILAVERVGPGGVIADDLVQRMTDLLIDRVWPE